MVGTKWIYCLGKSLYSLKDPQFSHCDLVVPLGYGLTSQKKLPDATEKTLRKAVQIAFVHRVPIAWASANFLWPGCEEEENRLKMAEVFHDKLFTLPIIAEGVINSVTEAQSIHRAIIKAGFNLRGKTIVVVADWPHTRSIRRIWRKIFPESTIIVVSIDGEWNEPHPCFFQRSELRWLMINIVRHIALIVLRVEKTGLYRQPMKRR